MNTLQDVREAQQMWERKFQSAGRERIVLNCGKCGSLGGVVGRIIRKVTAKPVTGMPVRKRHAVA